MIGQVQISGSRVIVPLNLSFQLHSGACLYKVKEDHIHCSKFKSVQGIIELYLVMEDMKIHVPVQFFHITNLCPSIY